jgi:hypothetical protein
MPKGYSFQIGATTTGTGLKLDDRQEFARAMRSAPKGLRVTVTVEEEKTHRGKTWEQVKYWWAVPVPILAEHCGTTEARMHRDLLGECFGYEAGSFGKHVPVKASLADLTVEETTHLIDWVLVWAPSELEVVIPPPDKQWKQKKAKGKAA